MAFNSTLALYIPSVPGEVADDIGLRHYFQRFGKIRSVYIRPQKSSDNTFQAHIYYDEWNDDWYTRGIQAMIQDPNETVTIDNNIDDGFFKVLPSNR